MPLALFEYTVEGRRQWAMVAVPPGRIPATADRARYLRFDRRARAREAAGAAATAYRAFLERWPDDLGASIGLANAHYALGDLGEAESALRARARAPSRFRGRAHQARRPRFLSEPGALGRLRRSTCSFPTRSGPRSVAANCAPRAAGPYRRRRVLSDACGLPILALPAGFDLVTFAITGERCSSAPCGTRATATACVLSLHLPDRCD